jgi:hypothetical protein
MRPPQAAALLALIGFALAPDLAAAPKRQRSVRKERLLASCPAFHQTRVGNEGLRFELANTCKRPVACTLTWSVHCRVGESPGERSMSLDLAIGATDAVVASGAACGAAGWDIDGIHWSCQPRPLAPDGAAHTEDGEL